MCPEDFTKIIKCNFHTISPLLMHLLNDDILVLLTFISYPPKVNVLAVNKTACMFKCELGVRKTDDAWSFTVKARPRSS